MKRFTQLEKKLIDKILRIHNSSESNTVRNIIGGSDNVLGFEHFYLRFESDEPYDVHFLESYYENVRNEDDSMVLDSICESIKTKIVVGINLFEYLEEEKYIISSNYGSNGFTKFASENEFELDELISSLSNKTVTPLDNLYKLKNNNYLTDEELDLVEKQIEIKNKKRKSFIRASIAVAISGLALTTSISYSSWETSNVTESPHYNVKLTNEALVIHSSEPEKIINTKIIEKPTKKLTTVKVNKLNIRKIASVKSKKVGKLFLGDTVEIIQQQGQWVEIGQYDNNKLISKGWVLLNFLNRKI